jgi:hypothetical protein
VTTFDDGTATTTVDGTLFGTSDHKTITASLYDETEITSVAGNDETKPAGTTTGLVHDAGTTTTVGA